MLKKKRWLILWMDKKRKKKVYFLHKISPKMFEKKIKLIVNTSFDYIRR